MTRRELSPRGAATDLMLSPFAVVHRLFDDFFPRAGDGATVAKPAIDVAETETEVSVTTELPGLKKDEVSITIEDGLLSISGERKCEETRKDKTWHLVERHYGRFHRSVALPGGVDASQAEAKFEDGVLTVTLPKTEAAKPKRVQIR